MINLVTFKPEHFEALAKQEANAFVGSLATRDHLNAVAAGKYSYTGLNSGGRVVFCAGVVEYWQGRGEAWAYLDQECRKEFISVHNTVRRFLDVCPVKRIEAAVECGFKAGHRWVKNLGFQLECERRRAYGPDGSDYALYVMVR